MKKWWRAAPQRYFLKIITIPAPIAAMMVQNKVYPGIAGADAFNINSAYELVSNTDPSTGIVQLHTGGIAVIKIFIGLSEFPTGNASNCEPFDEPSYEDSKVIGILISIMVWSSALFGLLVKPHPI